jgi:hypothetical protein
MLLSSAVVRREPCYVVYDNQHRTGWHSTQFKTLRTIPYCIVHVSLLLAHVKSCALTITLLSVLSITINIGCYIATEWKIFGLHGFVHWFFTFFFIVGLCILLRVISKLSENYHSQQLYEMFLFVILATCFGLYTGHPQAILIIFKYLKKLLFLQRILVFSISLIVYVAGKYCRCCCLVLNFLIKC